jgi:acetaldehyde dehydrogenase
MNKTKVAVIGSGNIGTDLMFKIIRLSDTLEMAALVGIDPASDGLARARRLGIATTAGGVDGLVKLPGFDEIQIVFDATSGRAHAANAAILAPLGKQLVDLTPAAIGPYTVPAVNLDQHLDAPNVNMVTCGGQATIPVVAAIATVTPVHYGEIVASIASKSAGPGTRANIDEFTETTRAAIEQVGGAARGKAIIVLNPADPPLIMRDTVLCLTGRLDAAARERSPRRSGRWSPTSPPTSPATASSRPSSAPTWTPPSTPAPSTPASAPPPAPRSACSSRSKAPPTTCRPTPGTWTS